MTQVRRYIAGLEEGMNNLTTGRGYFKDMRGIFPELRLMHCQHHYIFGLPQKEAPMLIIAIFYEKMELMAKLSCNPLFRVKFRINYPVKRKINKISWLYDLKSSIFRKIIKVIIKF